MRIGRYETQGIIGKGGMGTVYLARATGAGGFERLVALKVMHSTLLDDEQFVEMFLDEARLAARIHHTNVVATHDVHQLEQGLFLVMDYVEGPSLHSVLNAQRGRRKPLPLSICLRIFDDALAGLHAAHELTTSKGSPLHLVHRDISPDNILIGVDGVSRLTDFGLAKAAAKIGQTRGGHVKGKLAFLAPEAVMIGKLDPRADVYAIGVTLWEALTLHRLFEAENEALLMAKVMAGAQKAPIDKNPDVPLSISLVCMRACALHPDSRYQSAKEFSVALREAAREAGVEVASSTQVGEWVAMLCAEDRLLTLEPERPSTRPFGITRDLDTYTLPAGSKRKLGPVGVGATFVLAAGLALGGGLWGASLRRGSTSVPSATAEAGLPPEAATGAVRGLAPNAAEAKDRTSLPEAPTAASSVPAEAASVPAASISAPVPLPAQSSSPQPPTTASKVPGRRDRHAPRPAPEKKTFDPESL